VVDGALRWAAIAATLFLVTGFVMFAGDEMSHASAQQVSYLADPRPDQEKVRESRHTSLREAIDDVNDTLMRPFTGVVSSHDHWVERGVPTLLALLVYGLGLGFLARYVRVRS
jgi:hypothetical protein